MRDSVDLRIGLVSGREASARILRQEGIPFQWIAPAEAARFAQEGGVLLESDGERASAQKGQGVRRVTTSAGTVRENLALYPKAVLRRRMRDRVARLMQAHGLPFVRLGYYPDGYEGAFGFRIDVDDDEDRDLDAWGKRAAAFAPFTTVFVCAQPFAEDSSPVRKLLSAGYDLQSHGFYHHAYRDRLHNLKNLNRSKDFFRSMGRSPEGFASPMGRWNEALQGSLEEAGFSYSSDFGYDYDNLPSSPVLSGRASGVLQVPIHPVCVGIFQEARVNDPQAVAAYYRELIERRRGTGEPLFLYGHPKEWRDGFSSLPDEISKAASDHKIWRVTLTEFARWWRRREAIEIEDLRFNPKTESISYRAAEGGFDARASFVVEHRDRSGSIPLKEGKGEISVKELTGKPQAFQVGDEDLPRVLPDDRPWPVRLKASVVEALDWEEKTPLEDLEPVTPGVRAKRLLRRAGLSKIRMPF